MEATPEPPVPSSAVMVTVTGLVLFQPAALGAGVSPETEAAGAVESLLTPVLRGLSAPVQSAMLGVTV